MLDVDASQLWQYSWADGALTQVRKTPSWTRSWANFSLLQLYSHRNAWANLHVVGNLRTFNTVLALEQFGAA